MSHAVRWLAGALAAVVLGVAPAQARPLVSVEWLQQHLGREEIVLLDASPAKAHAAGHIPGAVNADVFAWGGREQSVADMEKRIRSWGVSPGKRVVIYDAGGTYFATSVLFDLYYHGFPVEDLAVLDGGLAKWQASGGAVTKDPTPAPAAGSFGASVREDVRVRLPEFLAASGDPAGHALVEALEPAMHFGGAKFFDRAGHVPHAIMLPTADLFNADKTFKSPAEIRRMLDYLGVKPAQVVHTHCGGGIAASVPFFAMKFLLDYPAVKLYKESQLEWLRDDRGLPFWTYDAPHLVRDKAWLSGWNNAMLRSFGVSRVSVVDVRPAAAFEQARVPFSASVPAEEFRRHLAAPPRLAEALAAAGVNPAFEAVVVSAGGLNPDSALAFLLLERLGQKRVSLLLESVDDWGFAGLALEKAAPRAAKPGAYPVALRTAGVIEDVNATQGLYPKVFIATGKAPPASLPEGKVVHVPYTELVDAKGAPRPAKDLWATLVKAGVPRYAELVAIADDPGEAAVGYVVLKLMGYPDVKVLLR